MGRPIACLPRIAADFPRSIPRAGTPLFPDTSSRSVRGGEVDSRGRVGVSPDDAHNPSTLQSVQANAQPSTQTFDSIRVRAVEVVDLQDKRVAFIGSDVMNGLSGVWIGGTRSESQQIELLVNSTPGETGTRHAFMVVRHDTRSVRNDPAVRGGRAGGPVLWQAP
jgi:hypothetical protein